MAQKPELDRLAYVSSAAIAALMREAALQYGVVVLVAAIPIIVMFLLSADFIFDRAKAADEAQAKLLKMAKRELAVANAHAAELQPSERRFHSDFTARSTHAAIGMALAEHNGKILQVNQAACKLLGYEESYLVGSAFGAYLPADDFTLFLNEIAAVRDGGKNVT